ncbi:MAG: RagB/SusD family nutrient uptake outer membrane protein [Flavobacteriaceae bacterium]
MKNYKLNSKFLIIVLISLLTACNDILEETPDNRTFIDTKEKISQLLVAAYPEAGYVPFLEPMSDNARDKGPAALVDNRINEEMYFWRDLNDIDEDTPTNYWNAAYAAIAQANQALKSIEELGGGEEFDAQKGEALVCRAYAHFMLVSIFSKAYNPATAASDLGIPYVTEPETVLLGSYSRASIEDVYVNIENDLTNGLPLIENNYEVDAFHFTKEAANAFASRFYLHKGEWQKVIDFSTLALGTSPVTQLRNINGFYTNVPGANLRQLYTSSLEPANLLLVSGASTYTRFSARARYQLSRSLQRELFGNNGNGSFWDYPLFIVGDGDLGLTALKINEYFRVTNQAAGIGEAFATFILISTDEVLLNRAEAYAMLEQYDNALADINLSYSTKLEDYGAADVLSDAQLRTVFEVSDPTLYTPFYTLPAEALPYINAVLTMKRTILYNEGIRWLDIKRHDMVVDHPIVNASGLITETISLPKGDERRALQIPTDAQSFGIEANPR